MFLIASGISCSPKKQPDPIIVTKVEKQENAAIFLEQYKDPDEPSERTVKALIEYILDQRAINAKHNADKSALMQK